MAAKRKAKNNKRNIKTKRSKTKTRHSKTRYNIIIAVAIIAIFLILFGIVQAAVMVMPTGKYTGMALSATKGRIYVKSTPSKASTYIDGVLRGLTPIQISVKEGWHTVGVTKTGYYNYTNNTYVYAGKTTLVNVTLVLTNPILKTGRLVAISDPSAAKVYLNSTYKGLTPLNISVISGAYKINISKNGYQDYINTIYIYTNTTYVNVTLIKK
ncbi:MAG: PEGA domain-containing protein [Candidatus Aenigmarchaeota archaeon]|nr:PEGA domain-containing protein [Candidatus Aenigmarchaeota archaeon]